MPTELWGEGRVVGYSAYEIYVKQHLALNPTVRPATERQWLASSLACGASLLLKVKTDATSASKAVTANWYRDYKLPENSGVDYSLLCAANTIVGSFFDGTGGYADGSDFAHKVTSYGNLIKNVSGTSQSEAPKTDGKTVSATTYPLLSTGDFPEDMQQALKNYMKVIDGVVIQPGEWKNTTTTPARDYELVDLSKSPTIRLHFRGPVDHDFEILLTGFSIRAVVKGESGFGGSVTDNVQFNKDGAFLGPGQYPWANKIVFSIPNAFEQYLRYNGYSRKLPSSGTEQTPKGQPIIDMEKTNPATYYSGTKTGFNAEDSRQGIDVTRLNTVPEEADVLTVYQRNTNLPPTLYGSKVTDTGEQYIYPLDTIAPGTTKMYTSEADAKTYQNNTPNNYSLYKNPTDNTVYHVKGSGSSASGVPIARQDSKDANYTHDSDAGTETAQVIEISTGDIKRRVLSMQNASGTNRTISSPPTSKYATDDDDIYWAAFLDILANNKKIDVLGDNLKKLKKALKDIIDSLENGSDNQYIIRLSKTSSGNINISLDLFDEYVNWDDAVQTYVVNTTVGDKSYKSLSLSELFISTDPIDAGIRPIYNTTDRIIQSPPGEIITYDSSSADDLLKENNSVVKSSYISWKYLFKALQKNKVIDILGYPLRIFKFLLSDTGRELKLSKHWHVDGEIVAEKGTGHCLQSGTDYIAFNSKKPNGDDTVIRLYITNKEPTGDNIPLGSIGIGWGE